MANRSRRLHILQNGRNGEVERFEIKDGKFDGIAVEGERRVEIAVYKSKIIDGGEVKEHVLPSRYHNDSTLNATVTAAGPNTFTFEVKSK